MCMKKAGWREPAGKKHHPHCRETPNAGKGQKGSPEKRAFWEKHSAKRFASCRHAHHKIDAPQPLHMTHTNCDESNSNRNKCASEAGGVVEMKV